MIIAPHVIGEDHLRQIEKLLEGRKVIRYSSVDETNLPSMKAELQAADVLIIDCFGLLSSIYHYGEIAYVGGGFGVGIHNVLEAAVWDVPVFFGPNNQRFQEAQGLKAAGGGFDFEAYEAFEHQMDIFLTDGEKLRAAGVEAGKFVQSLAGATEKVLSSVDL
jgi:3-deoxy-D-manno-octulosonic-acid transferase